MTTPSTLLTSDCTRPVYRMFQALLEREGMPDTNVLMAATLFEHSDTASLNCIAANANTLQRTLHLGTAAVARCLALAAPDAMDSNQCGAETVEAIGWLLAELSDLGALCHHFEATANRILFVRAPP